MKDKKKTPRVGQKSAPPVTKTLRAALVAAPVAASAVGAQTTPAAREPKAPPNPQTTPYRPRRAAAGRRRIPRPWPKHTRAWRARLWRTAQRRGVRARQARPRSTLRASERCAPSSSRTRTSPILFSAREVTPASRRKSSFIHSANRREYPRAPVFPSSSPPVPRAARNRLAGALGALATLMRETAMRRGARGRTRDQGGKYRGPLTASPTARKPPRHARGEHDVGAAPLQGSNASTSMRRSCARLREAGAVLVAKLSMIELAGGMGYNQADASLTGACAPLGTPSSGAAVRLRGRARRLPPPASPSPSAPRLPARLSLPRPSAASRA